jgi:hypothetical protein
MGERADRTDGVNGGSGPHKDDGIVTVVLEAAVVAACGKEVAGGGKIVLDILRQFIEIPVADGVMASGDDSNGGEGKRRVLVGVIRVRGGIVRVHVQLNVVVAELDVCAAMVGDHHGLVVISAFSVGGEGEFGGGNAEEEDEDLGHHGYMGYI